MSFVWLGPSRGPLKRCRGLVRRPCTLSYHSQQREKGSFSSRFYPSLTHPFQGLHSNYEMLLTARCKWGAPLDRCHSFWFPGLFSFLITANCRLTAAIERVIRRNVRSVIKLAGLTWLQQAMVCTSSLLVYPILLSDVVCAGNATLTLRVQLIAATFVACGFATILQTTVGLR